jgi:hypothetical protein
MNCPQCQTPNQQESAFCANCGTQLAPAEATASPGGYYPPAGQGAPAGYGAPGPSDSPGGYGPPSGYGQAPPTGQYPPPSSQPPGYPPAAGQQFQPRPAGSVAPFQFDANRLDRTDRIVGVSSLIVLISLFLPWFSVTVSSLGISESGTGSGLDAHGWLWLVFILDLFVLAYLVVRAGWQESPVKMPIAHAPLLIGVTGLQLLLVLIGFFDMPGNGGIPGVSIGWSWGAFVGLLAALAAAGPVIVPAVRSYMESRR